VKKTLPLVCIALLVGSVYAQLPMAGIFYVTRIKNFAADPSCVVLGKEPIKFTGVLQARLFIWAACENEPVDIVDSTGRVLAQTFSQAGGGFTAYWRPNAVGTYTVMAVYRGDFWNYKCQSSAVDVDVVASSSDKWGKDIQRVLGDYGIWIIVGVLALVAVFFIPWKSLKLPKKA